LRLHEAAAAVADMDYSERLPLRHPPLLAAPASQLGAALLEAFGEGSGGRIGRGRRR